MSSSKEGGHEDGRNLSIHRSTSYPPSSLIVLLLPRKKPPGAKDSSPRSDAAIPHPALRPTTCTSESE